MLIRLVYASTLSALILNDVIEGIVAKAAIRNSETGVTGILAIEDRKICQVLEGEEVVVVGLFREIEKDDRHGGVIEIERRRISERSFPEWSMTRRPMLDVVMMALA